MWLCECWAVINRLITFYLLIWLLGTWREWGRGRRDERCGKVCWIDDTVTVDERVL